MSLLNKFSALIEIDLISSHSRHNIFRLLLLVPWHPQIFTARQSERTDRRIRDKLHSGRVTGVHDHILLGGLGLVHLVGHNYAEFSE